MTAQNQTAPLPAGLAILRAPVPEHLISPLPKGTKAQNECPADQKVNCRVCGGWHHPKIRHLDYVGHAAATHLLLDADPLWSWEPLAFTEGGLPKFDEVGGLWIRLTVCGVTRLGYGNADKKNAADAGAREKEVIGDALRNAAMRFGLALELWSKADIHKEDDGDGDEASLEGFRAASLQGTQALRQHQQANRPTDEFWARNGASLEEAAAKADADSNYPEGAFATNLPSWRGVIESGRKTAAELIVMVESKGKSLTSKQKDQIRGIKTKETTE